jgi:hypothetical protein
MAFKTGNNHSGTDLPGSIGCLEAVPKAPENAVRQQILYTGFGQPDCRKGNVS